MKKLSTKSDNKYVGAIINRPNGITLISLVVTIVVLIILAGVAINLSLGENGIFNKAKEAKKAQIIANAKEQIGLEILEAQMSAIEKDKELEQSEIETIVSKYGKLQEDKDTIILNDGGYEISLADIYNTMSETEGKIENATSGKILKNYKAYVDGKLVIGTMENYAGQTVTASTVTENGENAEVTIPQAGYYDTSSKIQVPIETIKKEVSSLSAEYEISRVNTGGISGKSNATNFVTICCEGYSTLTFTTYGYANFSNGKIVLSIYGSDSFNDDASYGWYGNPCSGVKIKDVAFTSGQSYSIDVSAYKYVYFDARNNNNSGAGAELRHIKLS